MKHALSCTAPCLVLLLALPALAEPAAPAHSPFERLAQLHQEIERDVHREVERSMARVNWAFGPEAFLFAGRELEAERVVKGAPYCATAVHESVQTLGDGNRIVKKQSTRLCRDGEGRTRREVLRDGAPRRVYLHDPVARESWVLDPERKRAQRIGSPMAWRSAEAEQASQQHQALAERMREHAERWREWAAQVAKQAREQEGKARTAAAEAARAAARAEPGIVVETELSVREPGASAPTRQRDVRVIRLSELPAMAPLPPAPPIPPSLPRIALLGSEGLAGLPRGEAVVTALPAKEIEGIKVNGERSSWTIPAGQLGNEKPILITREVWRSPELMLTIASTDRDPRSGETSYRLEGVKRGEPDAALMKVPADYERESLREPRAPRAPQAPQAPAAAGKA